VARIALLNLRRTPGAFVGAFVAIATAAALTMACATLMQAGIHAESPVERYAAAPVLVTGAQEIDVPPRDDDQKLLLPERARLDGQLAAKLESVAGVGAVLHDDAVPARVVQPGSAADDDARGPGAVFLRPWSAAPLTAYSLEVGREPASGDEVVLDARLSQGVDVGERLLMSTTGPAEPFNVVGIASASHPVGAQATVFATDSAVAARSDHPGRVDAVGVFPSESTADLGVLAEAVSAAAGPSVEVSTGSDRGRAEQLDDATRRADVISLGGAFGGIALLIAVFVVASTLGLSVQQRHREIALLRAIAATPRQIRRMIACEAGALSIVAGVTGLVPGAALAHWLGSRLVERGVAPEEMEVRPEVVPALAVMAIVLAVSLLAVAAAGRRAARTPPTLALAESSVVKRLIGPARLVGGILALAGGVALLVASSMADRVDDAAGAAAGVSFTLVVAVGFLGPLIAWLAAAITSPVLSRLFPVGGFLAGANLRTQARAFSAASTALVLSVAMAATLLFINTTQEHAAKEQGRERVVSELAVQAPGPGLPASAADEMRATPGVKAAVGIAPVGLGPGLGRPDDTLDAQAVAGSEVASVLDLDLSVGSLASMPEDGVALSLERARAADAEVGAPVSVTMGDGSRIRLTVVAIYRRDLGFGEVLLPFSVAAPHMTTPLLSTVQVRLRPQADRAQVERDLVALRGRYPGIAVSGRGDLERQEAEDAELNLWVGRMLALTILLFTSISVVNTLTMLALARRRELGLLRLAGGTVRQLVAMATWETCFVVLLGLGLGGAIALATLVPFSEALTGSPVPYAPPLQVLALLCGSAAIGILGSAASMRLALATRDRPR
jgi:putative ABC transport system permease protein